MNQKEEIGKIGKELKEKEVTLKQLKAKLEEKYADTIRAVNKAKMEKSKLNSEKQSILIRKVRVFSDSPAMYIHRSESHQINSDIANKIRQIEEETGQKIFSESTNYIWQNVYHEIVRKIPGIKKLDNEIEKLEEYLLEGLPEGYEKLQEEIEKVTSRISWLEQRITRLSDIGYFRQWAKELKDMEKQKEEQKERGKAVEKFKAYFDKEYLPKIIEGKMQEWVVSYQKKDFSFGVVRTRANSKPEVARWYQSNSPSDAKTHGSVLKVKYLYGMIATVEEAKKLGWIEEG